MIEKFIIEVDFSVFENEQVSRYVEIDVDCEYVIETDGIGPYEFWGQKGYNHGTSYVVIEGTNWNARNLTIFGCFTKEETDLIESEIEKKLKDWEDEIMDRVAEKRSDCYFPYSDDD